MAGPLEVALELPRAAVLAGRAAKQAVPGVLLPLPVPRAGVLGPGLPLVVAAVVAVQRRQPAAVAPALLLQAAMLGQAAPLLARRVGRAQVPWPPVQGSTQAQAGARARRRAEEGQQAAVAGQLRPARCCGCPRPSRCVDADPERA